MKDRVEFKTFEFEIKEASSDASTGTIQGYASAFGNVDMGLDVVDKGAFKVTIRDNKGKFPILADHNPSDQIGWNESASEDNTGLFVKGSIMLDVQKGREKYALAKKALEIGAKAGLSIGYSTIKAEPDKENPSIRRLKELKLWEYSLVTFPMNTDAMVTAAKSIGQVDKAKFLIEHLKQEGISIRDLEIALRKEAADLENDPMKISHALDNLIAKFKDS